MAQAKLDENSNYTMMKGTGGEMDYLLVALKGEIGLGLKPNMIAPGKKPGTTYVGARIRSAVVPEKDRPKSENNVVSLAFKNLTLKDAWPGVTWEKADAVRASTQIGIFLRGTIEENPKVLLDELAERKLATKMADYLIELVGEENMVLGREELIDWIDKTYAPVAKKIEQIVEANKAMDDEIENSIGTFGMQADIMKKVYNQLAQEGDEVPDLEDDEHGED